MTYQDKAKEIIAAESLRSYQAANLHNNGSKRKRHVPYSIPDIARAIIAALNADDEYETKRLMMIYRTGSLSLI